MNEYYQLKSDNQAKDEIVNSDDSTPFCDSDIFFSYHNTTLCDGGVRLFIVAFSWREAKANHPHLSIALVPKRHHLSNFSFGCRTTTAFHIILPYKDKDVRKRIRKSKNNTNMVSPTFFAGKGYGNIKERTEYTSVG